MDADVTGPSIPKAFGVKGPLSADTNGLNPGETESGIKMISTNLMLPQRRYGRSGADQGSPWNHQVFQ